MKRTIKLIREYNEIHHVGLTGKQLNTLDESELNSFDNWVKGRDAAQLQVRLANKFSSILHEWLTKDQMAQVIARNKKYDENLCATHDFCDPNQAMLDAFEDVLKREFVFFNGDEPKTEKQFDKDSQLWDAAWTIAKANEFNQVKILTK